MLTTNLTSEERSQFRQIAATVDAAPFAFSIQQLALFRLTLAGLLADDTVLTVAPATISATPLDAKVKSAIFALFERARQGAARSQGELSDAGNLLIFGAIGALVGIGLGWLIGR